jgi:hypothetical protein
MHYESACCDRSPQVVWSNRTSACVLIKSDSPHEQMQPLQLDLHLHESSSPEQACDYQRTLSTRVTIAFHPNENINHLQRPIPKVLTNHIKVIILGTGQFVRHRVNPGLQFVHHRSIPVQAVCAYHRVNPGVVRCAHRRMCRFEGCSRYAGPTLHSRRAWSRSDSHAAAPEQFVHLLVLFASRFLAALRSAASPCSQGTCVLWNLCINL